jgi:excinuclease ABC subunit C
MGDQSVASMVVWEGGQMKKSDYRRFKIKTVEGANDFASMQEVVTRRYGSMEDLARPDLVLIDGGIGQLTAALEGLRQVHQPGIPILGLAKARGDKQERVFLAGRKNPIVLKPQSPATHLLQRIRDEAHRFAITFHRKLRRESVVASKLDQIIGIGEIRRNRLLSQFGSLDQLASASDEALHEVGLNAEAVSNLHRALKS